MSSKKKSLKRQSLKKIAVKKPVVLPASRVPDRAGVDSLFADMRRMQNRMDGMFNALWSTDPITGARLSLPLNLPQQEVLDRDSWVRPLSDFYETPTHICADVDLPGIAKKDIKLDIATDRVEIRAEKKRESKDEGMEGFRMERSYSGFFRSFVLPSNVDASKATARFKDGVLYLRIPKSSKSAPAKRTISIV
ncbi:MAG: Hsp20/alpha crystallin family protein [archaeon]